jgi:hypothetical protein
MITGGRCHCQPNDEPDQETILPRSNAKLSALGELMPLVHHV